MPRNSAGQWTRWGAWTQHYAARIREGHETCRAPGCTTPRLRLRVTRIDPDGPYGVANATILCRNHTGQHIGSGGEWRLQLVSLRHERPVPPLPATEGLAPLFHPPDT